VIIAYLTNVYPSTSHSYIRREIQALETQGFTVYRFPLKRPDQPLVTQEDREEASLTKVVRDASILSLVLTCLISFLAHPHKTIGAAIEAMFGAGKSSRSRWISLAYLVQACSLVKSLKPNHIEHLHVQMGTNAAAVAVLCRKLGGPSFSISIHGPEEFEAAQALRLKEKFKHASFIRSISHYCTGQLQRYTSDHTKIHGLRCGLDDSWLNYEVTIPPNAPNLVCVGRLCPRKMQHMLLDAVAALIEEGHQVIMTLIGDGPDRRSIEDHLSKAKLVNNVRVLGWGSEHVIKQ